MQADRVYIELEEFVRRLDELRESLMDREMLLVDQIEVHTLLTKEINLTDLTNGDKSPDIVELQGGGGVRIASSAPFRPGSGLVNFTPEIRHIWT